ncbi:hypothetical protein PR048_011713, partial [Dryococelus australis]
MKDMGTQSACIAVASYNKYMGGVDLFDHQRADQLIGEFCSRFTKNRKVAVTKKKFNFSSTVTVPNTEGHLPIKGTSRRCASCSTRSKPVR